MVRLICYNIEYCEGMEGLWYQYLYFWRLLFPPQGLDERIVDSLKLFDPDVLALVEVDTGSFRAKKDEAMYFEKELGMSSEVEQVKYPHENWMRLFHHVPILNKQANAIVSRYKLTDVIYHMLHEGTKRMVIQASIHTPKKVTLLLAHLALGKNTRERQLEELAGIINTIKGPVILAGDFNTFNGEHEIYRLLRKTHLRDKHKLSKQHSYCTQPAWHPRRRLDYILTSPEVKVSAYEVINFHFSDHLPIYIDFDVA